MSYSFQALEKAFHFGLVIGTEKLVARSGQLAALDARGEQLAPELLVRNSIDERFARAAAKMTEKALSRVDAAGIDQRHVAVAAESEVDNQRRHAGSAVEPEDFVPRNDAFADGEVMLIDLNGRLKGEGDQDAGRDDKQECRDECRRPLHSHPAGKHGQADRD